MSRYLIVLPGDFERGTATGTADSMYGAVTARGTFAYKDKIARRSEIVILGPFKGDPKDNTIPPREERRGRVHY